MPKYMFIKTAVNKKAKQAAALVNFLRVAKNKTVESSSAFSRRGREKGAYLVVQGFLSALS
jgi:hypothetical protein